MSNIAGWRTITTSNTNPIPPTITAEEITRLRGEFEREYRNPPLGNLLVSSPGFKFSENPMSNLAISAHNQYSVFEMKLYLSQCSLAERGLVEAILRTPNDPALRDVYSDYLLENGRELEAESERNMAKQMRNPYPAIASGSVSYPRHDSRHNGSGLIGGYMNQHSYPITPAGSW